MKRLTILLAGIMFCTGAFAQSDSTVKKKHSDTIRIGNIVIIKRGKRKSNNNTTDTLDIPMGRSHDVKTSGKTTNWLIVDLGFSGYSDNTNYATAGTYLVNRPGSPALSKDDFKTKSGKSINVNIWFFMQTLPIIKQNVNLKYGLGLELNNYKYKSLSPLSYKEGGEIPYSGGLQTASPFIFKDSITFSKNKLAADYLTVPLMLNLRPNKSDLSLSFGVSAGYLYSQRNKQVSKERGKEKNKGDYNLERFKFSYVAEIGLGHVKLYGSYSPQSMYENALDMRPFNFGFRLTGGMD